MYASPARLMLLGMVLIGAIGLSQGRPAQAQTPTPPALTATTLAATGTAVPAGNQTVTVTASLTPATATPTSTVAPTATATATVQRTDDPTAVPLDPVLAFLIVLTLLILAIFVLSRLFTYLTESRQDYYATVREFARKGVFFSPVMVQPIATAVAEGVAQDSETTSFEVTGPGALAPGQPGVFTALRNGGPATTATWELSTLNGDTVPADTASLAVAPDSGSATVIAAKTGALVLVASLPETPVLTVRTVLTVVEPPVSDSEMPSLPFIGQGFGSIISAIVLIAALVVLASTRAIDADVVGVVLGALAGYLFGVGIGNKT